MKWIWLVTLVCRVLVVHASELMHNLYMQYKGLELVDS